MDQYLAEFVGTLLLILLGDGVVAAVLLRESKAEDSDWIVITFGWGMAVAMAVYAVGSISGAHINPAVTVALASIGEFEWAKVPGYVIAQMLGAFTGAALVYAHYLRHFAATEDPGLKLAVFSTGPAIRDTGPNFASETIATAVLIFGVLGIGNNAVAAGETLGDMSAVISSGLNPLLVGLLVLSIGLSLGGPTGYAINPARDLGPRVAHAVLPIPGKGDSDWSYSWIPVVAPIVGGILGGLAWAASPFAA